MGLDKKQLKRRFKKFIGKPESRRRETIVIIALILAFDLSGFGGQIYFYSKWIACGQKPVVANPGIEFGGGSVQDYASAPSFSLLRPFETYYCTPFEAEKAGLSANPDRYEYPHLKAAGEHVNRE